VSSPTPESRSTASSRCSTHESRRPVKQARVLHDLRLIPHGGHGVARALIEAVQTDAGTRESAAPIGSPPATPTTAVVSTRSINVSFYEAAVLPALRAGVAEREDILRAARIHLGKSKLGSRIRASLEICDLVSSGEKTGRGRGVGTLCDGRWQRSRTRGLLAAFYRARPLLRWQAPPLQLRASLVGSRESDCRRTRADPSPVAASLPPRGSSRSVRRGSRHR
jgi:hypothetical protein